MRLLASIPRSASALDNPFITVIVVDSFRKDFIEDAVRSAFNQTLPRSNYEVIVIKNFSDPVLDQRLSSMGAKLLLSSGLSPGEKVSEAISMAKGEVLCFLDDDDMFEPTKLQRVYELFNAGADYYHNGQKVITDEGKTLSQDQGGDLIRVAEKEKSTRFTLLSGINSSCISIRKSILLSELHNLRRAKYSVDSFYLAAALLHGKVLVQDREPLTTYRRHSNQSDVDLSSPYGFVERRKRAYSRRLQAAVVIDELLAGTPYQAVGRRTLIGAKLRYARYVSIKEAGLKLSDVLYAVRLNVQTLVATRSFTPPSILRVLYSSLIPFLPSSAKQVEALREYKRYSISLYPPKIYHMLSLPSRATLAFTIALGIFLAVAVMHYPHVATHVLFHLEKFRRLSLRRL